MLAVGLAFSLFPTSAAPFLQQASASPTQNTSSASSSAPSSAEALKELDASLSSTSTKIDDLSAQIATVAEEADASARRTDELSERARLVQTKRNSLSASLSSFVSAQYKMGGYAAAIIEALTSSTDLSSLVVRVNAVDKVFEATTKLSRDLDATEQELNDALSELDEIRALQSQRASSLDAAKRSLEEELSALDAKKTQVTAEIAAEQAAKAIAASGAADEALSSLAFATGSTDGWMSGVASAYGGESDPSTPNPGTTATGALCDDWSMGVAVPMAMSGYRSLFGMSVEISYGGRSVIAVVNDCGYMGAGARALDLQPGVWKALGFSSCNDWGLRTVSYRFL